MHTRESVPKRERDSLDQLIPSIYGELRRISAAFLHRERDSHTLQPTALANEVYLRLAEQRDVDWRNPAQVIGLSVQMMRRILVNYAEARKATKRGPTLKLSLDEAINSHTKTDMDIVALHEALAMLAEIDPQKSKIVELRFFGGLTMQEISYVLGKSVATLEREWRMARAWLYRAMHS
jgi:RNA polymerase sigma factor (TIGR02999 family)